MLDHLLLNHYEAVAVILFGIGFSNLLFQRNLIKKIIGLNIMDSAVYLFLAAKGCVEGRMAPLLAEGDFAAASMAHYVNPIPAGLVLTGIVVSVSVTAFSLALALRLHEHYGTLNVDDALFKMRQKQEREAREDGDLSFELLTDEFREKYGGRP